MTKKLGLFLLVAATLTGAVTWWAGIGRARHGTGLRVVVVGLDGAHPGILSPLIAAGRLPNLERFLARAAGGLVDSPVHEGITSPALWTTAMTGVDPEVHGITDFVLPMPGTDRSVAAASGHRTAPALWNILDDAGLPAAIVGLWATWPAEALEHGAIVSDHVTYSRMRQSPRFAAENGEVVDFDYDTDTRNVYPTSLLDEVMDLVRIPAEIEPSTLRRFADFTDDEVRSIVEGEYGEGFNIAADKLQELKVTAQSDRSYRDIGMMVREAIDPSLLLVYLEGIDVMEHKFWPYHDPTFPRDVGPDRNRFSDVLSRYCEFTDELIGPYLELASEDTVVIVMSDHGYGTIDDQSHVSGHWHNRNAIFFATGGPIRPGATIDSERGASLRDVTPTLLALLGLPIADDLPGRPLLELLEPEFLTRHPLTRIDSFGSRRLRPGDIDESDIDDDIIDRLKGLGYLSGSGFRFDPVDVESWTDVRHIAGRLATRQDCDRGFAVFHGPGDGEPGDLALPSCAIYRTRNGIERPVIVIQHEVKKGVDTVGFRYLDGGADIASLDRLELLEGPDDRFR